MHYLDDFHTLGPPGSSVCQTNLDRSIDCFSKLGVPLHPDKIERPSTCLTILGIELDSLTLQARLRTPRSLLLARHDQPAMCLSSPWPPDSSQSGVLPWPCLVAGVFPVMVAASFSTPSGLHSATLRFLQMPLERLVTVLSSRVTGFQVHGSQHRSLLLSSSRNFSLLLWQLTSGVPYGPPNGSTSNQITWQYFLCICLFPWLF